MMLMRTLSCNLHPQEQCLDILLKENYYKKMYKIDACDGGGIILCKILLYYKHHLVNVFKILTLICHFVRNESDQIKCLR